MRMSYAIVLHAYLIHVACVPL